MKTLTLKYKNYGKKAVFDSIRSSSLGNGKLEEDTLYFNDLNSMYKFLSPARAEILRVIKLEHPESIYDLSQKLGKDQGYVSKEIKLLTKLGIVELIPENSGSRERLTPVLKFDRIIFDVGIDEVIQTKKLR